MFFTILSFSLGNILLVKSQKGLSFAQFVKKTDDIKKTVEFFKKNTLPLTQNEKKFSLEKKLFSGYFNGKPEDFTSLSIDLIFGSPFQKRVWQEARKISYGKTETYKSLAHRLGHRGYRSIGQALSKNPLLIVIPCHRVLRSDGNLGGFSAGLEIKIFLLRLESRNKPA